MVGFSGCAENRKWMDIVRNSMSSILSWYICGSNARPGSAAARIRCTHPTLPRRGGGSRSACNWMRSKTPTYLRVGLLRGRGRSGFRPDALILGADLIQLALRGAGGLGRLVEL